jgi:hypothetical protein
MKHNDKRKNLRAPVNIKTMIFIEDSIKVAYLKNISTNGAFIKTFEKIPEDAVFKLMFALEDFENLLITNARIVRIVKPADKAENYVIPGFGIEFLDMDFENISLIEDYLNYIVPLYEEINLLIDNPRKNINHLNSLLEKVALNNYKDFYELKDELKYICLSLGIIK